MLHLPTSRLVSEKRYNITFRDFLALIYLLLTGLSVLVSVDFFVSCFSYSHVSPSKLLFEICL